MLQANAAIMFEHLSTALADGQIPVCLYLDGKEFSEMRADAKRIRRIDSCITLIELEKQLPDGLELRVECRIYADFPVLEATAYLTGTAKSEAVRVSNFGIRFAVDGAYTLMHGNGDTLHADGYSWKTEEIGDTLTLAPADGTSCNGAFPYMRLKSDSCFVNLAIGWPTRWQIAFSQREDSLILNCGQKRFDTVIRQDETMRTPSLTLQFCAPDEDTAINLWRRWYREHILPKDNFENLQPLCCMHLFAEGGKPEFTGASEAGQRKALSTYLEKGIRPDVWWIDAGWYPCDGDWPKLGNWKADPSRFPSGLKPIGKMCRENGIKLLLWFEPERVRADTELYRQHPEWLLRWNKPDGSISANYLLNIGDPECRAWLTDHVDSLIKEYGVEFYRQDFNFDPVPYWEQNEEEDRVGALENLHAQGYLAYWDELKRRNPKLLFDSCASGGRRNDLETMRRAVPLHYTDVGYGDHPIKLKQHRQMFEWIPYFRAHNQNWLGDDGKYDPANDREADRFSYYAAMAPALTEILPYDASDEAYALSREMLPVWRRVAKLMLSGDYYPLTEREVRDDGFCCCEFFAPETQSGCLLLISNVNNKEEKFTARLRGLDADTVYHFEKEDGSCTDEKPGRLLADGIDFTLPPHTGQILFFRKL